MMCTLGVLVAFQVGESMVACLLETGSIGACRDRYDDYRGGGGGGRYGDRYDRYDDRGYGDRYDDRRYDRYNDSCY